MNSEKRVSIGTGASAEYEATVTSPVNIAVIKYWGKRNTDLILPTNSSLSCTLSQDDLHTKTTVRCSPKYKQDRLWLNGFEEPVVPTHGRGYRCLQELRQLRKVIEDENPTEPKLSEYKVHIVSENNFPTAAGLASSASGYAALVQALANMYNLTCDQTELSKIARLGSGSATRSVFGGFVEWKAGEDPLGSDSCAVCVAPETHWPSLRALVLVVSDAKKGTPSTSGMSATVSTSTLFEQRIKYVVPERLKDIKEAILNKDFKTFAEITMRDSNQFHAVCLDTYPPITYMNNISIGIIRLIHMFNSQVDPETNAPLGVRAAYTFDAGPNAVIYTEESNIKELVSIITHFFPPSQATSLKSYLPSAPSLFDIPALDQNSTIPLNESLLAPYKKTFVPFELGSIRRIIYTKIGDGPRFLNHSQSLLNEAGMPKRVKD
ncbi:hypothetical protein BB560_005134 [Smittium megazygosporum]|uniref:Diphosphomevalonate decarboxylase n=1 Tax=Smittium megazygosporum TaxID=133381 RepID=A0A2T9Z7G0_9FUNG|nr:hypothetical protein BB560_005134 [Smittium megazygosporum]